MPTEPADHLQFVATARVAALFRDRADLHLRVDAGSHIASSGRAFVLLATPLDDVDGVRFPNAVRIAVLEDAQAALDDARFDDYIFTSATRREIAFRALRVLRRAMPASICLGPVSLDVRGHVVPLSLTEHRLLARLLERRGAPVSRSELERVLGEHASDGATEGGRALDAHIYRLRRKLRPALGVRIETLRQRGFSISVDAPDTSAATG